MLSLSNEQDFKTLASALRRELKAMGLEGPSHNQMLEAVAKSLGHKSYAALKAAQPEASPQSVPPVPAETPVKPVMMYGYSGEPRFLAEIKKYEAYRLFNFDGSLDLVKKGELAEGLYLGAVHGTLDDILACTGYLSGASRKKDGSLKRHEVGESNVNWDGQVTRTDTRGVDLFVDLNYEGVPEDTLMLVPEGFARQDVGESGNLLSEEVVEQYHFPVREDLVDACKRWLVDNNLVAKALEEMNFDKEWGGFGDGFAEYADAIDEPTSKDASALGQAQWVAGFQMHLLEFKALHAELVSKD